MATVGTLNINFETNVAGLINDMQKASRGVQKASADMSKSLSSAQNAVRATIAAFGGFAAFRFVRNAVTDLGDLADAADKAGVSAEKLQVFRLLGQEVGAGAAAADSGLQEFIKRVGQAQAGTGKLLEILKDYNIALKDSGGARSAADIMADLADVIAATSDAQEDLRIASSMGMEDFVAALNKGKKGLSDYESQVRRTGLIIDESIIKKADEFDLRWQQAMTRVKGYTASWAISAVDSINKIVNQLSKNQMNLLTPAARSAMNGPQTMNQVLVNEGQDFYSMMGLNQTPSITGSPGANKLAEEAERLQKSIENMSRAKSDLYEFAKEARNARGQLEDLAMSGVKSLEDSLVSFMSTTKSAKEAFRDFALSVVQDIQRMLVQKTITGPLSGFIDSALDGLFTVSSDPAKLPGHAALGPKPAFASGGSFEIGGKGGTDSNLVQFWGTKGEEVIIRNRQQQMAAGSGGSTFVIDARGADTAGIARLEAMIRSINGSIERRALGAVQNEARRNPAYLG